MTKFPELPQCTRNVYGRLNGTVARTPIVPPRRSTILPCTSFGCPPVFHQPYEVQGGDGPQRRERQIDHEHQAADSCGPGAARRVCVSG